MKNAVLRYVNRPRQTTYREWSIKMDRRFAKRQYQSVPLISVIYLVLAVYNFFV